MPDCLSLLDNNALPTLGQEWRRDQRKDAAARCSPERFSHSPLSRDGRTLERNESQENQSIHPVLTPPQCAAVKIDMNEMRRSSVTSRTVNRAEHPKQSLGALKLRGALQGPPHDKSRDLEIFFLKLLQKDDYSYKTDLVVK